MIVTKHAIQRYRKRIEDSNITAIEAKHLIQSTYEASEQIDSYTQVSRHVKKNKSVMEFVQIMLYGNMVMVVITREDKKMIVTCYDYKGSIHDNRKVMTG